jgi:tetratricopeptide (TPR) repeat protein
VNGHKPAYRCWYNHSRARTVCSNSLMVDMHLADDAVLRAVTRDVLDPDVVREALDLALRELEQPDGAVAARLETLKTELARLDAELARYAEAIADAGPLDAILQAIKARQLRRDAVRTELKTLATQRRAEPQNMSDVRATLVEYLNDWRAMARQGVTEARSLLRTVLVDRLVFTPMPRPAHLPPPKGPGRKPRFVYELMGEGSLSKLFTELISASSVVAPTGFPVMKTAKCRRDSTWVLAQLGEATEAQSLLREGEDLLERQASRGSFGNLGWFYPWLGRAALVLGRPDDAQRLGDRAVESSPRQPGFAAHALHLLGDIATHPDRFDAERGETYYRQALALAEPRGMRPLVAHCHLGLGKLCARTGKREHAREYLTTATTMYREMDMRFYLEQAEAELKELA